jgi:hypothetical protein
MLAFWSPGWTLAGCALAIVAAFLARGRLARAARMPVVAAAVYVAALGASLAVTLSPRSAQDSYFVFGETERACDVVPADLDLGSLVWAAEWQFNALLLMPLGAACRLARDRRSRLVLIGCAAAAPLLIEAVQYAVMSLYRVCEGTDVLTNWLGLASGYALAGVASAVHAVGRGSPSLEDR